MTNCIFEPSINTSSATICKWCGEEKILHNHNRQVPQLYTEEQVREAMNEILLYSRNSVSLLECENRIKSILQSLKQLK